MLIEGAFDELAAEVADFRELTITPDSVALPQSELRSAAIVLDHDWHYWDDQSPCDRVEVYASPGGYRAVGLWLLGVVFGPHRRHSLELAHAASKIKRVVVEIAPAPTPGLVVTPSGFVYQPAPFQRESALEGAERYAGCQDVGFPWLALGDLEGGFLPLFDEDLAAWRQRNLLTISGDASQVALLANYCLDIGRPETTRDEFDLIYTMMPRSSCEVRFHLPGSFVWPEGLDLGGSSGRAGSTNGARNG